MSPNVGDWLAFVGAKVDIVRTGGIRRPVLGVAAPESEPELMASTTAKGNGSGGVVDTSRRLPDGVEGMLIVGKLRHLAQSTRSDKQLLIDVETVEPDGHVQIQSVSGWMMGAGEGAGFTTLGNLYAGGHLGKLVGQDVCLSVSARAAATASGARLYITAEGIWPLAGGADVLDGPPPGE